MNNDVVSAEKAQQVIDAVNAACELGDMSSDEEAAALTTEALARTVITLHAREAAQATELAVLRAQLPPLLAVHDALVAAAALPGAGASPEAMVAAVRRKGVTEGAGTMKASVVGLLLDRGAASGRHAFVRENERAAAAVLALPLPGAEVSCG